jgi:hypothetical protein
MDFFQVLREIVSVFLQFERSASTDEHRVFKESLKRDHNLLLGERAARPAVDASGRLFEPPRRNVLAAQRGRVAVPGQPSRIDDQTLGEMAFQPV